MNAPDFPLDRPEFGSAENYVSHVRQALSEGKRPWDPKYREELRLVLIELPEQSWRFRATDAVMRSERLPLTLGRKLKPFRDEYGERLVETICQNKDLQSALRFLLGGAK